MNKINQSVRLIARSKLLVAEALINEGLTAYVARITSSNPDEVKAQSDVERLIKYCLINKHWSIFEHDYLSFEITTSLDVATQLLRHRSACFQQFSQRYSSNIQGYILPYTLHSQSRSNRQASSSENEHSSPLVELMEKTVQSSNSTYKTLTDVDISRQEARLVLPQCTATRLIMTANLRSWLTYLDIRLDPDHVQPTHREIALMIAGVIFDEYSYLAEVTNNFNDFKGNFIVNLLPIDLDEFFNDWKTLKEYQSCIDNYSYQGLEVPGQYFVNLEKGEKVMKSKYESKILKSGNNLLIKLWNNIMN
jgi:thymidylate synthase (FAD)